MREHVTLLRPDARDPAGSRGFVATALRQGGVAPVGPSGGRDRLDPGSGTGLVGDAPAGVDFVKPACTDS